MSTIADAIETAGSPVFLVELEFGGIVKRYGTRTVTVTSSTDDPRLFRALMLSVPEVGSSFDFSSCRYSIGTVHLEIDNSEERLQDYEPLNEIDGGEGRVYLWADGLTWEQIDTEGLIFRGTIRKESHDKVAYSVDLIDKSAAMVSSLPGQIIATDNWPNHRTEGGGGSVAGKAVPMIFGDWPKGIPLLCVDTTVFGYIACRGYATSTEAEYQAHDEDVFDLDGAVVGVDTYVFGLTTDSLGNPCSAFVFTGDASASEPLSCSIRGITDTSGAITGSTSTLIENPGDIVLYVLQNHSALVYKNGILGSDDYDWSAFRTVPRLLPASVRFASYINATCDGLDYIDRILAQCLCPRTVIRGVMSCVSIDLDAEESFALSDDDLIGLPTFGRTDDDNLGNDWVAKYALNPTTGEYEKSVTANKDNDDDCRKSHERYGAQTKREIEFTDIQDESTAKAMLKRHALLYAYRRDTVTLMAKYWRGFDPVEGDVGLVTLEDAPAADGAGWQGVRCMVVEKKFQDSGIALKLMKCEVQ